MTLLLFSGVALAAWTPTNDAVNPFNKAVSHFNNRQPDKALKALDKALESDPSCGMCLTLKAETLVALDQATTAWELIVPAFTDLGENPDFLARASLVAFAAQQFEDARNLGLAAVAQPNAGFDHWQALTLANIRLGNYDDAEFALQNARTKLPEGEWNCLAGSLASERGRFAESRELLEACSIEAQRNVELANLAMRAGDHESGAAMLEQAGFESTSLKSKVVQALNNGDPRLAHKLATEAIAQFPKDGLLYINRASASYQLGNIADALDDLQRALGSPEFIQGSSQGLTGVLSKSSEQDYRESLRVAAVLRTDLLLQTGQVDEARTRAVEAGRLLGEPELRELCEVLVDAHTGQVDKAWVRLKPVLEGGSPDSALLEHLALGVGNRADGQAPDWLYTLVSSNRFTWGTSLRTTLMDQRAVNTYNAAIALWNKGEEAEARAVFAQACQQAPESRKKELCSIPGE